MRNIKSIVGIILALILAFSITGCSTASRSTDEILSDLENAGFKTNVSKIFDALSEITNNNDYEMSCFITNNAEFENTNIYECSVVCANSDFEITYDLKVTYVKNDGWDFSGYEIADANSKIKSKIPEERILYDISAQFAKDGKTANIIDGSILQTLDDGGIGCNVTADGELVNGILTEKCIINVSYSFLDSASYSSFFDSAVYSSLDKWKIYVTYTCDSYEWDVQALAGKKWVDSYEWSKGDFIYIESVNETDSTMMVGYKKGFYISTTGSREERGKPIECRYKLEEGCIKIMTGDLTLEIEPDMGILMSGYTTYPEN